MLVTISASYGAGGSELGPKVAEHLGVPFIDRVVPVEVAARLGMSSEEAELVEQTGSSRLWDSFAAMSPMAGFSVPSSLGAASTERELIAAKEAELGRVADTGDGVVLGHGAAVVLAERPGVLHVRLDGSAEGRVRAAMEQHGIGADEAEAQRKQNDKVRSGYVKHFYHRDSSSPELYHLVLDTVRLGWDLSEELILHAAQGSAGS